MMKMLSVQIWLLYEVLGHLFLSFLLILANGLTYVAWVNMVVAIPNKEVQSFSI